MDKLTALIPLLGWFYISLAVSTAVIWIFGGRFPQVKRLFYGAVGSIAVVFILQSLMGEIALVKTTAITLDDSVEQKMANESSDYYKDYYLGLRKHLNARDVVYLPGSDTQQYHYARTFLYPAEVLQADIPETESLAIVHTSDLKNFKRLFEVLASSPNLSLIRVEGVRR